MKIGSRKIGNFFIIIFALIIVLDGNSIYSAMTSIDLHLRIISLAISVFMIFICKYISIKKNLFMVALSIAVYCGIYFLMKNNTVSKETYLCLYVMGMPVLIILFSRFKDENREGIIFIKISDVVVFLAVLSLIFWMLGCVMNVLSPSGSVQINWGQVKYVDSFFGLHFITQIDNSFASGIVRNSGIFCEAPMFNLWLDIALSIEFFLKDNIKKWRVAVLIVTILSTTSTTGIIFVLLCATLKYYLSMENKMMRKRVIPIIVLLFCVPYGISIVQMALSYKEKTSSYLIRMQDYVAGLTVWKAHPLLGSGFGNTYSLYHYILTSQAGNVGFSNSITAILGTGGLWNFLIYILSITTPIVKKYAGKKSKVCFMICFAFLTVTTSFYARFIFVVFISYGLSFLFADRLDFS